MVILVDCVYACIGWLMVDCVYACIKTLSYFVKYFLIIIISII